MIALPTVQVKLFEIRDSATFIPCFGIQTKSLNPQENYLLRRCGYGWEGETILFGKLNGDGRACSDAYDWGDRTMKTAHLYIEEHWPELNTGDVIDVEFILGETSVAKKSEREEGI